MYEGGRGGGVVLGASTTVAGVAVLPNTGGSNVLTYTAITAIALGVVALVLQISVMAYRLSLRRR